VKFTKVNVDNAPGTASRHGVRGVPALFFYKKGAIVDQAVGALPKNEIARRLDNLT
jgi:thioredoxin 1